jgi:secreted Zn-dependent insulinase-like peptidase
METHDFADKLLPELSLDEMEFACDLERVLAEQVKYLRTSLAAVNNAQLLERDSLILDLRARLAEKDREMSRLQVQNDSLQKRLLETLA